MKLSNKAYDILKWVVGVCLPALGALYAALGVLWGFPYIEQICGTITALVAFGDTLLGISSIQYKKRQASGESLAEKEENK